MAVEPGSYAQQTGVDMGASGHREIKDSGGSLVGLGLIALVVIIIIGVIFFPEYIPIVTWMVTLVGSLVAAIFAIIIILLIVLAVLGIIFLGPYFVIAKAPVKQYGEVAYGLSDGVEEEEKKRGET